MKKENELPHINVFTSTVDGTDLPLVKLTKMYFTDDNLCYTTKGQMVEIEGFKYSGVYHYLMPFPDEIEGKVYLDLGADIHALSKTDFDKNFKIKRGK